MNLQQLQSRAAALFVGHLGPAAQEYVLKVACDVDLRPFVTCGPEYCISVTHVATDQYWASQSTSMDECLRHFTDVVLRDIQYWAAKTAPAPVLSLAPEPERVPVVHGDLLAETRREVQSRLQAAMNMQSHADREVQQLQTLLHVIDNYAPVYQEVPCGAK